MRRALGVMAAVALVGVAMTAGATATLYHCQSADAGFCADPVSLDTLGGVLLAGGTIWIFLAAAARLLSAFDPDAPPRRPGGWSRPLRPAPASEAALRSVERIVSTLCWSPLPLLTVLLGFTYLTVTAVAPLLFSGASIIGAIRSWLFGDP